MAEVQVLFPGKVQNSIGAISIDATIEETHERSTEVTDHPVEGGSFIQDHIINAPRRLTMVCMVTDTPLNREPGLHAQAAFNALEELRDARQLFTVVSGFKVYENMAFESLTMPKTREGALRFTATMKQITLTTGQVVPIESVPRTDPKLSSNNVNNPDRNANGTNVGRQSPRPASETQTTKTRSVLSSILGGE